MTKTGLALFLIWALAFLLAMAMATLSIDSVAIDGSFLPASNDAFYHARRILDAVGERGFYQFDPSIHVPEGSWITWPWGYDRAVAGALQIALWLDPGTDPMAFLAYVPVAWLPVNIALLLALCAVLQLRLEFRALVALGFSLSPLSQTLHRIGEIDHHFLELTFVLLSSWLTLRWFKRGNEPMSGVLCGLVLGIAPAFHNGLFILQLPVLLSLGILWLRGNPPGRESMRAFAAALFVAALVAALFSEPLRDGQFSLATLSWFHVYIAGCTALLTGFMTLHSLAGRTLVALFVICALLFVPVLAEVIRGGEFLTGRLLMLDRILEMTSPLRMITGNWGLANTLGMYTGLLLIAPLLLLVFLYRLFTETSALHVGFAVFSVFGLCLMLFQFRLHYFGLPPLLVGGFYLLQEIRWTAAVQRSWTAMASVLAIIVMLQPALSGPLFATYPLANDHLYQQVQPLFRPLNERCRKNPGAVAAASQFGHYIRFHSECPVIANNFLLTDLHFRKVQEVNGLFHMTPSRLRAERPDIRYVLAFLSDAYELVDGEVRLKPLVDLEQRNPPLIVELFFKQPAASGFNVIGEVTVDAGDRRLPIARLYEIETPK